MMWKTPPMRRRIAFATILFGTLAVSGCASSPGNQTLSTDLFAAARQSERAPDALNNALPRKSCGDITLKRGEEIPTNAVDQAIKLCERDRPGTEIDERTPAGTMMRGRDGPEPLLSHR